MFGAHDLALFAFTVLVLNATPGVDLMLTLTRTLQFGIRAGWAAALGIAAGCVVHTLAAAFGLAALLAASSAAFTVVKWVGALYLVWLAWGMLRTAWRTERPSAQPSLAVRIPACRPESLGGLAARGSKPPTCPQPSPSSGKGGGRLGRHEDFSMAASAPPLRTIFRQGLLTNALNPKVALFFLALLPQFIGAEAANKELAFLFLGAWFVVQGGVFLLLFAWCVATLRRWAAPPAALRALHAFGAALFAGLAARLALAGRP